MLFGVILFTFLGLSLGEHCDIRCNKDGEVPTARSGDCICSPGFPGRYAKKGYLCSVRLSVNRYTRVRLKATHFRIRRTGKHCTVDYLRFYNRNNPIKKEYPMDKVCHKRHLHKRKDIIINSSQVRLVFRVDPTSKLSVSQMKWRVCLKGRNNPNSFIVSSCPFTMSDMKKGFNRRTTQISTTTEENVIKFCCTATGLQSVDYAMAMCKEDRTPNTIITKNGEPFCVICSNLKTQALVEADIVNKNANKKIQCTCDEFKGVEIGGNCTGNTLCLDTNLKAFCDTDDICVCPEGMMPDDNNTYCGLAVGLGDDCSSGEICNTTYGRAECNGTHCVCPDTFSPDPTNEHCTKDVPIGDACTGGIGCLDTVNRATCINETCQCPAGTSPHTDNSYCTYNSNYGGYCEVTVDCIETRAKKCESNLCVCDDPAYSRINNFCYLRNTYNQFCEYSGDCAVTNSQCSGGKCLCRYRYWPTSSTVCTPYCWHGDNFGRYYAGKTVCNQYSNHCHRCKCEGPPRKLTFKKRVKKPCWKKQKDWNCFARTFRPVKC